MSMGVYIKGMEMPTDGHWGTVSIPFYIHGDGSVSDSKGHIIASAVPVPPHGRLIDASESIRVEFYDEEHEDWTRHDMTIDDLLSQSWVDADAPTIIPAEPCNNLSKPCKEDEP